MYVQVKSKISEKMARGSKSKIRRSFGGLEAGKTAARSSTLEARTAGVVSNSSVIPEWCYRVSRGVVVYLVVAVAFHCTLFTVHCFSAGPNFIAKQGQLRTAGQPANGAKKMWFRLCTSANDESTYVWSTADLGVDVYCINGMFNYPLSVDKDNKHIKDLDFANNQYYMAMSVDGTNWMKPFEPMAALPYAFCASTATNLRGDGHIRINGAGPHYIMNGNVGIGIANPTANLYVVGASTITSNLKVGGRVEDKTGFLVPVGAIQMYGGSAAPAGWLLCNGAAVSRMTYADLFTAIGTTFGAGDGSTTFNLPDMRGVFPKGAGTTDRTLGKDANNNFYTGTLGTYLTDKFQGHLHSITHGHTASSAATSHTHGITDPGHSHSSPFPFFGGTITLIFSGAANANQTNNVYGFPTDTKTTGITINAETGHMHGVTVNGLTGNSGASNVADGSNGTPRYGTTTEPQSLGVNYIIKY